MAILSFLVKKMTNKIFVSVIILLLFLFLAAFFVSVAYFVSNQQNDDMIPYSEYLNETVLLRETGSFEITVSTSNGSFVPSEETTTIYLLLPNETILDNGETENYTYYWNGSAFVIDETDHRTYYWNGNAFVIDEV